MPLLSGLVAEDLLSRCTVQLSIDLKCDIHDVEEIKVQVAGTILSSAHPIKSWTDFSSPIPEQHSDDAPIFRSTGFSNLDALFDGGLHPGNMIQVLGAGGSGKTQFALHSAISCARRGLRVLMVNTCNDVGVYRIRRMLDYSLLQEALSTEKKHEAKMFILGNLFIQSVFDIWSAMDLLCRVREQSSAAAAAAAAAAPYDVIIVDCVHQLMAPHLSHISDKFSAAPSSTSTSTASASAVPMAVHFQPLLASFFALLRSFAGSGATVMVTNVLEKEKGPPSSGGGTKLPCGTGAVSADVFDHCLVLSANQHHPDSSETSLTASKLQNLPVECYLTILDIVLRPPQYNNRPSLCELKIPRI